MTRARAPILIALCAALVRLIPLQWLHPLAWDELEFWRASAWIAEGRVPYRDFWEHHTPLTWMLFAPFTWLSDSPGVDAVIVMRWAQVLVWIATFWLANLWMRELGVDRFARWSAMALVLASSLFMRPATEYRVDSVACALFMASLVLAQRERHFLAGVAFCMVGLANLRFGPVVVVAVLLLRFRHRVIAGGVVALVIFLAAFAAFGALDDLYQHVWVDNLAEKHAVRISAALPHRLLASFGVRLLASDRVFEPEAIDAGGVAVILLGFVAMIRALLRWRDRDALFVLALILLANLLFIAWMKFVFSYHFLLVVVLMIPLIASLLTRVPRRAVMAMLAIAFASGLFASIFRGKELDRAHQDTIMREVQARTREGDRVWSGVPWALRRAPAYHFWFLPELAVQLVKQKAAPPYDPLRDPPAAVVFDRNALVWSVSAQPDLSLYFLRHYIPVWRELWVPGMNVRLQPGGTFEWIVPRDGAYRVHATFAIGQHPWFTDPTRVATGKARDILELTPPDASAIQLFVDGRTSSASVVSLGKGQRVAAFNQGAESIGIILLSSDDRLLFRQPPPGVSLDAEAPRVTHVPVFPGSRREATLPTSGATRSCLLQRSVLPAAY